MAETRGTPVAIPHDLNDRFRDFVQRTGNTTAWDDPAGIVEWWERWIRPGARVLGDLHGAFVDGFLAGVDGVANKYACAAAERAWAEWSATNAPPGVPSDVWRSIESAPKDGTQVYAWTGRPWSEHPYPAHFANGCWHDDEVGPLDAVYWPKLWVPMPPLPAPPQPLEQPQSTKRKREPKT